MIHGKMKQQHIHATAHYSTLTMVEILMKYLGIARNYDIIWKEKVPYKIDNQFMIPLLNFLVGFRQRAQRCILVPGEENMGPYWLVCMQFYFEKMGSF